MARSRIIFLLVLILGMQFLLRVPFLNEPMEGDEGAYAYIAQGISRGDVPYRDTFDHKPPAIYFIYAGIFKLFGENLAAVRFFSAFYSMLTTLAIFLLAALLLGASGGLLSALFFAVFINGPFLEGTSSNSEVFMILPVVLSFLFFVMAKGRKSAWLFFLAGLLAGSAAMIKQVAFINFLVLVGFVLLYPGPEKRMRSILCLFAGFLVPAAGFSLYFLGRGAFGSFWHNSFLVNIQYIRPFAKAVNVEWGRLNLYRMGYLLLEESILFILGTGAAVHILLADRERKFLLLLCWAVSSCLGVMIGRYLFGHYFIQLLPPLAILGAYAVMRWKESRLSWKISAPALGFFAVLATAMFLVFYKFYLVYDPDEIAYARYHIDNLALARETGRMLGQKTVPSDRIMVWGTDPQVYFYSQRGYPGKYIYLPFHFPDLFEEACLEAERIAAGKMVKYIILARPVYGRLYGQIERNYKLILSREGRYHGKTANWGVFELK